MKKILQASICALALASTSAFAGDLHVRTAEDGSKVVWGFIESFATLKTNGPWYDDASLDLLYSGELTGQIPDTLAPRAGYTPIEVNVSDLDDGEYSEPLIYAVTDYYGVTYGCRFSFDNEGNVEAETLNAFEGASDCSVGGDVLRIVINPDPM